MSMICPLCHFFMYKSVWACCGHMFCQFCLDEYLIFKDSCPVWEKAIRRGKITRWCVADSAIDKIISFSSEEFIIIIVLSRNYFMAEVDYSSLLSTSLVLLHYSSFSDFRCTQWWPTWVGSIFFLITLCLFVAVLLRAHDSYHATW